MIIFFLQPYDFEDGKRSRISEMEDATYAKIPNNVLWRYHTSIRLNSIVSIPMKRIWYKNYINVPDKSSVNIILFSEWVAPAYDRGYIKFLRKEYPNAKICFLLSNPLNSKNLKYFNYFRETFDRLITFDYLNAVKYGLYYYNGWYEKQNEVEPYPEQSDVFFVGRGKDRLEMLHEIYNNFSARGIKCDFFITEVDKDKQLKNSNIQYNTPISYKTVLKHILATKCILEILQEHQSSYSIRVCESIVYKKHLITNNKNFLHDDLFNSNWARVISDPSEIDRNFIESKVDLSRIKADFSTERFIAFLKDICK